MKDADIVGLITKIGYVEGLPVVTDPGILRPADFIDEVVKVRLPNPFIPDMPQRIERTSATASALSNVFFMFGHSLHIVINELYNIICNLTIKK